jgi:hypothetical protein
LGAYANPPTSRLRLQTALALALFGLVVHAGLFRQRVTQTNYLCVCRWRDNSQTDCAHFDRAKGVEHQSRPERPKTIRIDLSRTINDWESIGMSGRKRLVPHTTLVAAAATLVAVAVAMPALAGGAQVTSSDLRPSLMDRASATAM